MAKTHQEQTREKKLNKKEGGKPGKVRTATSEGAFEEGRSALKTFLKARTELDSERLPETDEETANVPRTKKSRKPKRQTCPAIVSGDETPGSFPMTEKDPWQQIAKATRQQQGEVREKVGQLQHAVAEVDE